MKVLENAPESVVDEVYRYTLYLIEKSNAPVAKLPEASLNEAIDSLRGSIKYNGTADDIRAERLGLVC
jgi:hypothetical protein